VLLRDRREIGSEDMLWNARNMHELCRLPTYQYHIVGVRVSNTETSSACGSIVRSELYGVLHTIDGRPETP
jgi:hypothetical protein